jgi:hypothetical protein
VPELPKRHGDNELAGGGVRAGPRDDILSVSKVVFACPLEHLRFGQSILSETVHRKALSAGGA